MNDEDPLTPPFDRTRILIVDGEPNILELLTASLRLSGFITQGVRDGASALAAAEEFSPDLVIIDVVLPGRSGFDVVRDLRSMMTDLPVLFLTARNSVEDRIAGLRSGADDYVAKPFSLEEVVLRMNAILRRTGAVRPDDGDVLRYADLELDEGVHEVRRDGRPIRLSPTEFAVLRYLMVNAGKVVSKPQILDRVWNGGETDSRLVESYISHIRRKIDPWGPPLIHTVWGVGYCLRLTSKGYR